MPQPNRIRSIGLKKHLDATKAEHNNRGYLEFVKYLEMGDEFGERVPGIKMARAFNVSRITMDRWIIIYHEEQAYLKK